MNVSKFENEPISLCRMPVAKLRAGKIQSLITGKDLPPTLTIQSDRIYARFQVIISNNARAMFKLWTPELQHIDKQHAKEKQKCNAAKEKPNRISLPLFVSIRERVISHSTCNN